LIDVYVCVCLQVIVLRLRGGGDAEPMTCVAVLASGSRKGEVCGKTGKEFGGKIYCGYHIRAAKNDAAKKMAEIDQLMEKLGVSRDDVMKAWEGGEGSSDVAVGVPIKVPVADVADETAEVEKHDLD
jgi:hypothetical protein